MHTYIIPLVNKVFVSFAISGVPGRFCHADYRNNFEIFLSRKVFEKKLILNFKNIRILKSWFSRVI